MKFIVYEIWTSARVIEAEDPTEAYEKGEPKPRKDLALANWHVVSADGGELPQKQSTGALGAQAVR